MRLNIQPGSTRIGDVQIHEVFRVTELDAGHVVETNKSDTLGAGHRNVAFSREALHAIERQLAIVVPCMNEEQSILDGVLHGIPHDCLIILVSNSDPSNFQAECRLLTEFCSTTDRQGIVVHQHDEGIAGAFHAAGMPEVVLESSQPSRVRNGKGEAMMIGVVLAKLAGKQFVGFVDADNLVAGSVHEYCKAYAAGLHYALNCTDPEPHAMVRIKWNSKPKVRDNKIIFEKSGRSSRVVNKWMNHFLSTLVSTAHSDLIQTGNAGEHAMSLDLAMQLRFATGYAVEPFQLVDVWERLGVAHTHNSSAAASSCSSHSSSSSRGTSPHTLHLPHPSTIQILQIETRNPHFHDTSKGNGHIMRMQTQGLSTIYHSNLTSDSLKNELAAYMQENLGGVPEQMRVYSPLEVLDLGVFRRVVKANGKVGVIGYISGW
jgi:mannosyl-3-phosphoglycerate synthase